MMRQAWIVAVLLSFSAAGFAADPVTVVPSPEEQAAAEAAARQKAVASIQAQFATEREIMEAIVLLSSPGWERAKAMLVRIGRPAVPYLIEAMAGQSAGAFPAGGYPLAGPGRATRTVSMKDAAFAVLVGLFQNHSNYNGALPGMDALAWREFWTHCGANVEFGKP